MSASGTPPGGTDTNPASKIGEGGSGSPETTIAAILREHARWNWEHLPGYGDDPSGADVWQQLHDDAGFLAAAVVKTLGLQPELLHLNEHAARNGAAPEIQRRFVTPWEAQ